LIKEELGEGFVLIFHFFCLKALKGLNYTTLFLFHNPFDFI
jgi:hypothetical protein